MTARRALGCGALAACTGSIELTVTDEDATTGGFSDAGPSADAAPLPADCREALTPLAVEWSDAPAMPGVARPVTLRPPIGGLAYRYVPNQALDPPCPGSSLSQLADATAIDRAGFTTMDGTCFAVEADWIVDPDGETTCAAGTSGDKDAFLHAVLCAMHDVGVFNFYPTPKQDAAHRDHVHVDLTDGADFANKPGAPAIAREVAE